MATQLFRLMEDRADVLDLTRFDAVLIGGGPLAHEVRAEAEGYGINVVQTYGMSETCGGCVYDGRPLDGVELRIGDDGEVLLRGPMLFDGYEDEPERTAAALRDGWFHTDDLGEIVDGRLRVTGRRDDVIISGGVKVPGAAVADLLRSHWIVDEAAVVGVEDEEWGERVVAFIVLPDHAFKLNPAQLQAAQGELDRLFSHRAWAPKEYRAVPGLPLLANGKVDRVALKAMA